MGPIDDWFSHSRHLQGYTPRGDILDRLDDGEDVQDVEMDADMSDHIRQWQMQEQRQQQQAGERRSCPLTPAVTQLSQEHDGEGKEEEEENHGGDGGNVVEQREGWSPANDDGWT